MSIQRSLAAAATRAAGALGIGSPASSTSSTITYASVRIDGVDVFYRQAGPSDAPAIVLLHGFPSSSAMFASLIPLLADRYRLIAPDYPGFGQSASPGVTAYDYTFDGLTRTVERLLERLDVQRYSIYMQDYGGPIGMRLAVAHPERVEALIVQNANAYDEGLGPKWKDIAAFWKDRDAHEKAVVGSFTSLEAAKQRHIAASPRPERYDPATWNEEFRLLSRPGQFEIQAQLLFDYQENVAKYPEWQRWLREHRPATLVVWGEYDKAFIVPGALAYERDLPEAEIHVLQAGHFALDEQVDTIASLIRDFLDRHSPHAS